MTSTVAEAGAAVPKFNVQPVVLRALTHTAVFQFGVATIPYNESDSTRGHVTLTVMDAAVTDCWTTLPADVKNRRRKRSQMAS